MRFKGAKFKFYTRNIHLLVSQQMYEDIKSATLDLQFPATVNGFIRKAIKNLLKQEERE